MMIEAALFAGAIICVLLVPAVILIFILAFLPEDFFKIKW